MTEDKHPVALTRLAKNVKKFRLAKKMSQARLAVAADIRQALVSTIESSDANPTLDSLIKVADALGVEVADLFGTETKR